MIYINQYTAKPHEGQIFVDPSETTPDMVLSIPELIEKTNRGLSVPNNGLEYLDNEEPLPPNLDLTDITEARHILERVENRITELEELEQAEEDAKDETQEPPPQDDPPDPDLTT